MTSFARECGGKGQNLHNLLNKLDNFTFRSAAGVAFAVVEPETGSRRRFIPLMHRQSPLAKVPHDRRPDARFSILGVSDFCRWRRVGTGASSREGAEFSLALMI